MAAVKLQLVGMEQTLAALKRAPDVVAKHASQVIGRNAIKVATRARQLAPVGPTGELSRSIGWRHQDGQLFGGAGIEDGSPAKRYWYFVEMGTVNTPAQPFFRPAAESTEGSFLQDMREIGPDVEQEMGQ